MSFDFIEEGNNLTLFHDLYSDKDLELYELLMILCKTFAERFDYPYERDVLEDVYGVKVDHFFFHEYMLKDLLKYLRHKGLKRDQIKVIRDCICK